MTRALLRSAAFLSACTLAAPAVAQQEVTKAYTAQTPRPAGASPGPQAFSVVLVLGDMQSATQDDVPAAARKALADMKDFLPYKGYRLLDTLWTLCCGRAPLTGRLKGVEEQDYELTLDAGGVRDGQINVRFLLRESSGYTDSSDDERRARASDLEGKLTALRVELARREQGGTKQPDTKLNGEIASLQRQLRDLNAGPMRKVSRGNRGVIDVSFRMGVAETVVVGTSRVKGDKALIALLTAVPQKGQPAR